MNDHPKAEAAPLPYIKVTAFIVQRPRRISPVTGTDPSDIHLMIRTKGKFRESAFGLMVSNEFFDDDRKDMVDARLAARIVSALRELHKIAHDESPT